MTFATELWPHQLAAVEKLQALKVGALLMEMGTGKTRTALELARRKIAAKKASHIVWLCPVTAKDHISADIRKHWPEATIYVFDGRTEAGGIPKAAVYIVGTESLSSSIRVAEALADIMNGAVAVADEAHMFGNPKALRTVRLDRIGERAAYRYILSGSLVERGVEDMFAPLRFLSWKILGYWSFKEFARFHLEMDETGRRVARRRNQNLIAARIAPYTYQVRKSECLSLPPKTRAWRSFDLSRDQKAAYARIKRNILFSQDALTWGDATIYRLLSELLACVSGYARDPDAVTSRTRASLERMFAAPLDNPRIKALLAAAAEGGSAPMVIWCRYRMEVEDVREALEGSGYSVGTIDGRTPQRERAGVWARLGRDVNALVCNVAVGGVAIDLSAASRAIYYSNGFSYRTRSQSEDRLHRPGQKNAVSYIDIRSRSGIDDKISDCLGRKENVVDRFRALMDEARAAKTKREATAILRRIDKELS